MYNDAFIDWRSPYDDSTSRNLLDVNFESEYFDKMRLGVSLIFFPKFENDTKGEVVRVQSGVIADQLKEYINLVKSSPDLKKARVTWIEIKDEIMREGVEGYLKGHYIPRRVRHQENFQPIKVNLPI